MLLEWIAILSMGSALASDSVVRHGDLADIEATSDSMLEVVLSAIQSIPASPTHGSTITILPNLNDSYCAVVVEDVMGEITHLDEFRIKTRAKSPPFFRFDVEITNLRKPGHWNGEFWHDEEKIEVLGFLSAAELDGIKSGGIDREILLTELKLAIIHELTHYLQHCREHRDPSISQVSKHAELLSSEHGNPQELLAYYLSLREVEARAIEALQMSRLLDISLWSAARAIVAEEGLEMPPLFAREYARLIEMYAAKWETPE
jgi:hypothetical protein